MNTGQYISTLLPEPADWNGEATSQIVSLDDARSYCESLALSHYENFHVATFLLPRQVRPHFYSVYAYCRWADDLGDETKDPARSLFLLDRWEQELRSCYQGVSRHPDFIALQATIQKFCIPQDHFRNLITAFRMDQVKTRYNNWQELLGYCRYSANPVGRLVLAVCGYRDPALDYLSDRTCTALQLANLWQDVRRDLEIGRVYIPLDAMARHDYAERDLAVHCFDQRFANLMCELVAKTWEMFHQGLPLACRVDRGLGLDIDLFSRGGMEILRRIERQNFNVLAKRPSLDAADKAILASSAFIRHFFSRRKS